LLQLNVPFTAFPVFKDKQGRLKHIANFSALKLYVLLGPLGIKNRISVALLPWNLKD